MGLIEKATNTKGVQMNQQTRDELKKVEESHTLAPGDLSPIHSETGSDLDSDRCSSLSSIDFHTPQNTVHPVFSAIEYSCIGPSEKIEKLAETNSDEELAAKPADQVQSDTDRKRVVLAGEEIALIECAHRDTVHGGRDACLYYLSSRFYWDHMRRDVERYVSRCHQCQLNRSALKTQASELRPIAPPKGPCLMYGLDLITLTESNRGNKYVVVAVDYFTKFPFARAIPSKQAVEIVDFLVDDIVCLFGAPKVIITDQGSEFRNQMFRDLLREKIGAQHRMSAPYHPETNGLVERMNQTVKNKLRKLLEMLPETWDDHLSTALMAIRSLRNRATKKSPIELLIGSKMRMPSDFENVDEPEETLDELTEEGAVDSFLTERFERLRKLDEERVKARESILKEQKKYKAYYDMSHKPQKFNVGQLVTKVNEAKVRSKGKTLETNRLGPFRVIEVTRNKTYALEGLRGTHSGDKLRLYDEPIEVEKRSQDAPDHPTELSSQSSVTQMRNEGPPPAKRRIIWSQTPSILKTLTPATPVTAVKRAIFENRVIPVRFSPSKCSTIRSPLVEGEQKQLPVGDLGDILYDDTVRRCLSPLYTKYPDMFWQWRVCDLFGITEPPGPHDLDLSLSGPYDPRKAPSFDRDHLKIVIADGNCGFRAIAHVISGDEEHHHFVRKKVCEFIEKKDDRWIRALTQRSESPIEYLNRTKMRESAIYMTEVELQAVAELLQVHIVCFGELWQRYNPDFPTNLRKLYTDSKLHDGRPVIALLLRNAHFYLIKKL
ncbi:hypothetical protein QR680_012005 [Steinernema hermaphroditum]|uniref:RNA-directed DNA polymerase n=1 Tax=Steinernema hermaphroditum TaxID=289476 RepID=A0AA39I0J5_9BILA|nr:hypothetical protein QR680_012005 [Steinernema hermaphroditum]